MRWFQVMRLCWALALCAVSVPLAAWSLHPVEAIPQTVAAKLPPTSASQSGRASRRYFQLRAGPGFESESAQILVLERDRGQRLWLYSATGELLRSLPLGAAPAPASVGVRGAALPLDLPVASLDRAYRSGAGRQSVLGQR